MSLISFKITIDIDPGTEDEMEAVIRECIKKNSTVTLNSLEIARKLDLSQNTI